MKKKKKVTKKQQPKGKKTAAAKKPAKKAKARPVMGGSSKKDARHKHSRSMSSTISVEDTVRSLSESDFNKLFKFAETRLQGAEQDEFLLNLTEYRRAPRIETDKKTKKKLIAGIIADAEKRIPSKSEKKTFNKHFTLPHVKVNGSELDMQLMELFNALRNPSP